MQLDLFVKRAIFVYKNTLYKYVMVNLWCVILVNEFSIAENNLKSSDRRIFSAPVEQDRRTGVDRRTLPRDKEKNESALIYALEALPPVRRVASLPDKIEKGEITSALGMASLALINFPEDLRDIRSAVDQVASIIKKVEAKDAYDYKNFQHDFSFFRGTLLEPLVDLKNTKHLSLAKKLLSFDKSLLMTDAGQKILDLLNVTISKEEEVKKFNKKTNAWEIAKDVNGKTKFAYAFEGNWFGKLTARAITRTTLIGTIALATLELPKIIKAISSSNSIKEKGKNTSKQILKSGINFATTTAGIAYCGAIGSKYGKGFGSLVGMGVGAIIGSKISQKIQEAI